MTHKLFPWRGADGAPSTEFAATIVAMPDADDLASDTDSLSIAALHDPAGHEHNGLTDSSAADSGMPDVVTDIGGLPQDAPDPAEAPTLSHIGRYALKRQLGAGGLGAVFEAWDPLLSRAVAVKTLQFDVDTNQRISLDGLFLNEARAAAGLNHKYIVTIHDAGLSAHGVYIAMERLYGRDLQHALADGWRPPPEQGVQLVRRITEALAYAHARGVVHCDIKPANIFLMRRDKPKVLDFGIARIAHGSALPALDGAVAGSPRYRAPEQLAGGAVDARTDLFSLGVVMYELLCGRRAFEGETLAEINQAVLHSTPRPVHEVDPSIPADLSAIVQRLMARAPSDRYTCASELAMDLRRWMIERQARHASIATAHLPAPSAAPSFRWSPRWLLGGAMAVGAVAALLAVVLGQREPAAAPSAPAAAPAAAAVTSAPQPAGVDAAAPSLPEAGVPAQPPAAEAATPSALVPPPAAPQPALAAPVPAPLVAAPPSARTKPGADALARQRAGTAIVQDSAGRDSRHDEAVPVAAPAPSTGTVQLAISPWGTVEVDGAAAGTAPPLTRLQLPEGTHTITVRNSDFAPYTTQVQVNTDRPITLRHRFGS